MPDLSPPTSKCSLKGSTSTTMLKMDNVDVHRWVFEFARSLYEAGIDTYSLALGKVPKHDGTTPYMLWLELGWPHGPEGDSKDWLKTLRSAPSVTTWKTKDLLGVMDQRTHVSMLKGIVYIASKRDVFNEAEHERYRALYDELMTDSLPLYQALHMELEDKFEEDYLQQLEGRRSRERNHIEGSERREKLLEESEEAGKLDGNWTEAVAALAIEDIEPAGLGSEAAAEIPGADAMEL
ncbi:hypothetical protein BDW68DRAFT_175254 [Aspergillus falconensis]